MSIGSVPPSDEHNCVKHVTFRNIVFNHPLKAIYIKTNPGDDGTGEIRNITYENIVMTHPIWWGVYIGPQQMKEPNGDGPGCMFYPLDSKCDTQPRISISDITLRNVTSSGGILPAGIMRCNSTNPCTNFHFQDVKLTSGLWDLLGDGFITEYVEGTVEGHVFPDPKFKTPGYYNNPANRAIDESIDMDKLLAPDAMMFRLMKVMGYMASHTKSGIHALNSIDSLIQ